MEQLTIEDIAANLCNFLCYLNVIYHPDYGSTKMGLCFSQEDFDKWVLNLSMRKSEEDYNGRTKTAN